MREIKFRFYDPIENAMFTSGMEVDYTGNVCVFMGNCECPIMQYTGLKDKNGKDIYEGDIVKYRTYPNQIIDIKFEKGAFTAGEHNGSSTAIRPKLIVGRLVEVIGNIYENPELLSE
jgi:uncharacterized phage protein (TIGR01671 family)